MEIRWYDDPEVLYKPIYSKIVGLRRKTERPTSIAFTKKELMELAGREDIRKYLLHLSLVLK